MANSHVPKKALAYFLTTTPSPSPTSIPSTSCASPRGSPFCQQSSTLLLRQNRPASAIVGDAYSTWLWNTGMPAARAVDRSRRMAAGTAAPAGLAAGVPRKRGEEGSQYALQTSMMRRAGRVPQSIVLPNPAREAGEGGVSSER